MRTGHTDKRRAVSLGLTVVAVAGVAAWCAVAGWQASDARAEPEPSMDAGRAGPTCGNGMVEGGEQCDGERYVGQCSAVDPMFVEGTLRCDPTTCTYDTSACELYETPFCGNGVVDGVEECDAREPNKEWVSCQSLGLSELEKTTSCSWRTCRWNRRLCEVPGVAKCGNGIAELDEECDGEDFHGMTCSELVIPAFPGGFGGRARPLIGGKLSCSPSCQLDTRYCTSWEGGTCGDGVRNNNERCDGADLGDASCRQVQRAFGTVSCNRCQVDYSKCFGPCVPSGGRISQPCPLF